MQSWYTAFKNLTIKFHVRLNIFYQQTLIFTLLCLVALTYAIPPRQRLWRRAAAPAVEENVEDLKDGAEEEEKDLKGSESAYHGAYYGWPGSYYPSYNYYSGVYHGGYYPYAYSPYSYWW